MVDDLFQVEQYFDTPEGYATISLYYKQTQAHTPTDERLDPSILLDGWANTIVPTLQDCIADDVNLTAARARHVYRDNGDIVKVTAELDLGDIAGEIAGPSHPNNLAALHVLHQSEFSKRTQGRFFLPAIPESQTSGNDLLVAYVNGVNLAFRQALLVPLTSISDGGEWTLQVRSHKLWYAPIQAWIDGGMVGEKPDPDWAGSMTDCVDLVVRRSITSQRVRQTKVAGKAV